MQDLRTDKTYLKQCLLQFQMQSAISIFSIEVIYERALNFINPYPFTHLK